MYLSKNQIKIIQEVNSIGTLDAKKLGSHLKFIDDKIRYPMIVDLVKNGYINYFYVGNGYNEHSSYNTTPAGIKAAKNGYYKHNINHTFKLTNKHKEWVIFIISSIIAVIAIIYSK